MKLKTLLSLALLSLLAVRALAAVSVPSSPGATEFILGGYVKFEAIWDSTQVNKNMISPILRNNDPNFHHGRLKISCNSTRFNFTMKGPNLWGAQVIGFIEMDFDTQGGVVNSSTDTVTTGTVRLRHAFLGLNWPETELMLGQYWILFSEFIPETADHGNLQYMGVPALRLPQIRLTQKFLGL